MAQPRLLFIEQDPRRSIREKELQLSAARSHAARLTHRRRSLRNLALPSEPELQWRPYFNSIGLLTNNDATYKGCGDAEEAMAIHSQISSPYSVTPRTKQATRYRSDTQDSGVSTEVPGFQELLPPDKSVQRHTLKEVKAAPGGCALPVMDHTYLSPNTLIQHGNSDPFSASPIRITPRYHSLISTWQSVFTQTIIPSGSQKTATTLMAWENEGIEMIKCAEQLHFILAWTSLLQSFTMPASQLKEQLRMQSLAHSTAGIASLRKNLPTMAKLRTLRAVFHLMGADLYSGYLPAAVSHFHALVDIVMSIGGFNHLPWETQRYIVISDLTISAAIKDTKPVFGVDEWDPGPAATVMSPLELDTLAIDLSKQQSLHKDLSPRLVTIFDAHRELLAVHRIAANITDPSRLTNILSWAQMRQYALKIRASNMKITLDDLSNSPSISIEKALFVAVDYFSQILWTQLYPQRTILAPFRHSDDAFEIFKSVTELESSCLTLWILFIAAIVEIISNRSGHKSSFFAGALKITTANLGLQSLVQVRQSLFKCLYQERTFDPCLHTLMDAAQDVDKPIAVQFIQLGLFESKAPKDPSSAQDFEQMLTFSFGTNQERALITFPRTETRRDGGQR
ncbi:hypothetical protein LTR84_009060 [Exophiala bonariae]|uniref:Transcription factor domain-containing protein n=1 Tax=Exophiala bonariae TaxID=1690606 RepID=A0AAV9MZ90_9EURO|nr:hypothetical protein LTR84_009060 [Exophiala bonariae]